jgi:hypothetical protein
MHTMCGLSKIPDSSYGNTNKQPLVSRRKLEVNKVEKVEAFQVFARLEKDKVSRCWGSISFSISDGDL